MKTDIQKQEKSMLEITVELEADVFESHRKNAIKKFSETIDLPGFRKGKIPEKMIVDTVGDMAVLEEMAELSIRDTLPKIFEEHKLDPIGRPEVSVTKLAANNPLEFKARVAEMPQVELPDYQKIAQKEMSKNEKIDVTDKDIDLTIDQIRQIHSDSNTPDKDGSQKDAKEEKKKLPELNDAFVKKLGDFKNVDDFKAKLRDNLLEEKKGKEREKKRLGVVETIIGKSKIDLPDIMVEAEIDKLIAQIKHDVTQSGVTFEDYIKHTKKTEEDMRKDLEKDAEKRARMQLVLNKIAEVEKIEPAKEDVEARVRMMKEQFPDADVRRATIYAFTTLMNQKVFEFLESQK